MTQSAPRASWIVIMGAAVGPDGGPSGAMRRRVAGAIAARQSLDGRVIFLATGGRGRYGAPEAQVMDRLLRDAGLSGDDIVLEEKAHDTLSSVENCAAIIARLDPGASVFVATDRYHLIRCVWLFRLVGVPARGLRIESGRGSNGAGRWLYYYVREMAAIPWDVAIVLFRRLIAGHGSVATITRGADTAARPRDR